MPFWDSPFLATMFCAPADPLIAEVVLRGGQGAPPPGGTAHRTRLWKLWPP